MRVFESPTAAHPEDIQNTSYDDVEKAGTAAAVIERYTQQIVDAIAQRVRRKGRELTDAETGATLRDMAPSVGIGAAPLRTARPFLIGLDMRTRPLNQQAAWGIAAQFVGDKLARVLRASELPAIRAGNRATYLPDRKLALVRSINDKAGLVHVGQHVIDDLGMHSDIGNALRNQRTSGRIAHLSDGVFALDGPWVDIADGIVYPDDTAEVRALWEGAGIVTASDAARMFGGHRPTEVWAAMAQRFLPGREVDLGVAWQTFPEQVAGFIALQDGALLEAAW